MERHVKVGYLAQSNLRVHFGPGCAVGTERLEIEWANGHTDVINDLDTNQIVTVVEGEGLTDRVPFNR